jgi:two-component system, LytTR family, sensor kinase
MNNKFPISRLKMYVVFFVANLFLTSFRFIILPNLPDRFHILVSIASLLAFWTLWEFILLLSHMLERRFPIAFHPNKRIIIQILATYILATSIGYILIESSIRFLNVKFPSILESFGYLLYFLLSIVMNLIYFGTKYFYNWKYDLVKLANVQREQTLVKYNALQNQLNPHFLFNALTSLNSLIFENQQLASDFLQQLSKVYRYVLQNKERQTVPLSTELDFISHYISLLSTRFRSAIEFNVAQRIDSGDKHVVPVTLQILIENAVKHNIASREIPLTISIDVNDGYLEVTNTVNKKSFVEASNRQGLENLKSLYQYLSDKPVNIIEVDSLFKVRIPLITPV